MRQLTLVLLLGLFHPSVLVAQSEGLQLCYRVEGKSNSRVWMGALNPVVDPESQSVLQPLAFQQQYRYQVQFTALQRTGGKTLLRVEWSQWQADEASLKDFKELLHQIQSLSPLYVQRKPSGELEFAVSKSTPAWARQAVGGILFPFQFQHAPNQQLWETEEYHPSGKIRCRYRKTGADKKLTYYNKAVVKVFIPDEEQKMGKTHQILGHLRYALDAQGVIVSIEGTLRERIGLLGQPLSHNDVEIKIRLTERKTLRAAQVSRLLGQAQQQVQTMAWYSLYAPPTEKEQELDRAQSLLRDTSAENLLRDLDALLSQEASPEDTAYHQRRLELQRKLEAGAVLYGDSFVRALIDRMSRRQQADEGFWMLLGVLSLVDSDEVRNAFLRLIREGPAEQRIAVARQLAFFRHPEEDWLRQLWEYARANPEIDPQQTLLVSLSALIGRYTKSALKEAVREWCIQQLEAGRETILYLSMLSNLRSLEALPVLEQYARRGDEMARQTAVSAMSKLDPEAVLPIWERLYINEPAVSVRQRIVEGSIEWWSHPKARRIVENALFSDPSLQIRKNAIQLLTSVAARDPEALQLLVRTAETNSDPVIRREAAIALAALRAQGVAVPNLRTSP